MPDITDPTIIGYVISIILITELLNKFLLLNAFSQKYKNTKNTITPLLSIIIGGLLGVYLSEYTFLEGLIWGVYATGGVGFFFQTLKKTTKSSEVVQLVDSLQKNYQKQQHDTVTTANKSAKTSNTNGQN